MNTKMDLDKNFANLRKSSLSINSFYKSFHHLNVSSPRMESLEFLVHDFYEIGYSWTVGSTQCFRKLVYHDIRDLILLIRSFLEDETFKNENFVKVYHYLAPIIHSLIEKGKKVNFFQERINSNYISSCFFLSEIKKINFNQMFTTKIVILQYKQDNSELLDRLKNIKSEVVSALLPAIYKRKKYSGDPDCPFSRLTPDALRLIANEYMK